jgi:hypothetical protein
MDDESASNYRSSNGCISITDDINPLVVLIDLVSSSTRLEIRSWKTNTLQEHVPLWWSI